MWVNLSVFQGFDDILPWLILIVFTIGTWLQLTNIYLVRRKFVFLSEGTCIR